MSRLGLKINNVTKYLDDGNVETLATINGLNLKHYGPFLFLDGAGSAETNGTIDVPKLCPPAARSAPIAAVLGGYGYGILPRKTSGGYVSYAASNGAAARAGSDTATTTGAGTLALYSQASFAGARPFLVSLLGDSTTANTLGLKINGTTKSNLVPSADDNAGSVFRKIDRVMGTNGSDMYATSSITASKWGNCVVVNLCIRLTAEKMTAAKVLGTLPEGYRPLQNAHVQMSYSNCLVAAYINTSGQIICSNKVDSYNSETIYGCAIFGTSNTSGSALFTSLGLKLNGTTKNFLQLANADLTAECTSLPPSNDRLSGTIRLWKWGKFVVGNAVLSTTVSLDNFNAFTLPEGYRPAALSTSSGFCYNARTGIGTGSDKLWASSLDITTAGVGQMTVASNGNLGLSFYHMAA